MSDAEKDSTVGLRTAASLLHFWHAHGLLNEGRHWLERLLAAGTRRLTVDRVDALYAASVLAEQQGDVDAGAAHIDEARLLTELTSDSGIRARVALADGLNGLYGGDASRACRRLGEARPVFGDNSALSDRVWILMGLGMAYGLLGDSDR